MVPWPLYCAPLALSLSRVGNAPADTTNIETTTATPAARNTADRADFSRTISLPPETPVPPTHGEHLKRLSPTASRYDPQQAYIPSNGQTARALPKPTIKPHRLFGGAGNCAYLSSHAPPLDSARALSGTCQHFSISARLLRRLVSTLSSFRLRLSAPRRSRLESSSNPSLRPLRLTGSTLTSTVRGGRSLTPRTTARPSP
jgi:hypothetical protein